VKSCSRSLVMVDGLQFDIAVTGWKGLVSPTLFLLEAGGGAVECHLQAMLTPSRTMDPDSTRTPKILLGHHR
jgi:hypothetical protein